MIFQMDKCFEFQEMRDFVVVSIHFPQVALIGGTSLNGLLQSMTIIDIESKSILRDVTLDDELKNKMKRIGHSAILVRGRIYILGGQLPFKNSLLILNPVDWSFQEKTLDFDFVYHSFLYCNLLEQFIVFDGKHVHFFSPEFDFIQKIQYSQGLLQAQTKYTVALQGPWLYIFGGYNGISYYKRFFRFHVSSHIFEFLPSLPNSQQIRLLGANMLANESNIFFVFSFMEIHRFNLFYIYNIERNEWENNYIFYHKNKPYFVNIYQENRFQTDMKSGMKSYHTILENDSIYIFSGGSLFFHYPNHVYEIKLLQYNPPKPTLLFNNSHNFNFKIHVDKKTIFCHDYILMKFSDYFQSIIQNESTLFTDSPCIEIFVDAFSHKSVYSLINYMYLYPKYQFVEVDENELKELVQVGQYFLVHCFLYDLESHLMSNTHLFSEKMKNELLQEPFFYRFQCLSRKIETFSSNNSRT
jgi:hypothetical protein